MRTLLRFFQVSYQIIYQSLRYLGLSIWNRIKYSGNREEREAENSKLAGVCVTDFCTNLGATFIKIGQILSSRPDLLPDAIIKELKHLQDQVAPFDFHHVERTIREDFGTSLSELYKDFNSAPIAAASIAQVHEAWLTTGERVAVKVRRPFIEKTMERDLRILKILSGIVDKLPYFGVLRVAPQAKAFADAIYSQLDLTKEADNNRRFTEALKDFDQVHFPDLYPELCSERVLTMEFCVGKKLEEVLLDPPIPFKRMTDYLFDIFNEMIYGAQFLHADLHPGNLLFDNNGRLLMLDTGLVADIPRDYVRRFLRIVIATSTLDGRVILAAFLEGRDAPPLSDKQLKSLYDEADELSLEFRDKPMEEIEAGVAFFKMFSLLRKYKIWIEPELTMIFVANITMEGIGKVLDPKRDITAELQRRMPPYLKKMDWLDPNDLTLKFYKDQNVL